MVLVLFTTLVPHDVTQVICKPPLSIPTCVTVCICVPWCLLVRVCVCVCVRARATYPIALQRPPPLPRALPYPHSPHPPSLRRTAGRPSSPRRRTATSRSRASCSTAVPISTPRTRSIRTAPSHHPPPSSRGPGGLWGGAGRAWERGKGPREPGGAAAPPSAGSDGAAGRVWAFPRIPDPHAMPASFDHGVTCRFTTWPCLVV